MSMYRIKKDKQPLTTCQRWQEVQAVIQSQGPGQYEVEEGNMEKGKSGRVEFIRKPLSHPVNMILPDSKV